MTTKRIYKLAYMASLEIWARESEFLKNEPDSELIRIREKRAYAEVEEIRKLLIAEENKNN